MKSSDKRFQDVLVLLSELGDLWEGGESTVWMFSTSIARDWGLVLEL